MINLSYLINQKKWKALIFIFLNVTSFEFDLTKNIKKIICIISYKNSKYTKLKLNNSIYQENNQLIKNYFHLPFILNKKNHQIEINIDVEDICNLNDFYNYIYKLLNIGELSKNNFVKYLLISLFIPRGSFDFKFDFFSVDIYRKTSNLLFYKNLTKLIISNFTLEEINVLNLNFREFQKQYKENISQRNTQIRIKLSWFVDKFINDIKLINIYKYQIILDNLNLLKKMKNFDDLNDDLNDQKNHKFIDRMYKYLTFVIDSKNINEENIKKIIFSSLSFKKNIKNYRNQTLKEIAKKVLDNKCYSCCNLYKIENRSFLLRNEKNYYFEIHHVLPFANKEYSNVDNIDNLVKLCPSCHASLRKHRAYETEQKEVIGRILKNSINSLNFIEMIVNNKSKINEKINFIYERLT